MIDLNKACNDVLEDVNAVKQWSDELYANRFYPYFKDCRDMFDRLKDKEHQITDEELSFILMSLPVLLFDVSEEINNFRISNEVVKMKYKEILDARTNEAIADGMTKAAAKDMAETSSMEYKLLSSVYSSLIERAEKEVTFAKELIMSAKKIWDARRKTELSNPVSPGNYDELPDYKLKTYIK